MDNDKIFIAKEPGQAPEAGTEAARQDAARKTLDEALIKNNLAFWGEKLGAFLDFPEYATGFKDLDSSLNGGLYPGLYILGAISSSGKTSFVLQMADQLAAAGRDVLFFSLEMAREELMAKSISRYTFTTLKDRGDTRLARTTFGVLNGKTRADNSIEEENHIDNASAAYFNEVGGHLRIFEGVGDMGPKQIREIVEAYMLAADEALAEEIKAGHFTAKAQAPVIVIDYLQILAPMNPRGTDKMNIDSAVLELKRISRDYKAPVIAISSLNRGAYQKEISMDAFKESGAIEYGSDVLLGLQFAAMENSEKDKNGNSVIDTDKEKRKPDRDMQLVILKNRNGRTGDKINFVYHTLFNCFEECSGFISDTQNQGAATFNRKRF